MLYKRKIEQYDLKDNYIRTFDSIVKAEKNIKGKKTDTIGQCLKGKSKTCYGFIWKYSPIKKAKKGYKICSKCKEEKSLNEFYNDKNQSSGYKPNCKICTKITHKNYQNNNPFGYILAKIKDRCNNKNNKYYGGKGIKCLLDKYEVELLWYIYEADKLEKPSLDRINPYKNYTVENCQFIELSENQAKDKRKPIIQYNLDGTLLYEYSSITEVQEKLWFSSRTIGNVANKRRKTAYEFKWGFSNEQ